MPKSQSQKDLVLETLSRHGMARLSELIRAGATAATVSRLEKKGEIIRLGRGLYQLPDSPLDVHHSLAEATKLAPKGIVCLISALAFHELTDRIPSEIWMAIGQKDWRPRVEQPRIHFVWFPPKLLMTGFHKHKIEGIDVRIYDPSKTVVDLFRYRRQVGIDVAVEGLKEALRQRKATPSEIARYAADARVWTVLRPYLEALTHG